MYREFWNVSGKNGFNPLMHVWKKLFWIIQDVIYI